MEVRTNGERIQVGDRFSVSFQRTLRIPQDDQIYPLPPTFGPFRIHDVADFAERVPDVWRNQGGFLISMYQREALWLGFVGAEWKPNAVKIAVGGVNAVSGSVWEEGLDSRVQNYVVCPNQPWLDGINAGKGFTRQFVAMPLGMNTTVEAQLTDKEEFGGIQLVVYEPKAGKFPDKPPRTMMSEPEIMEAMPMGLEMGLGAGGRIKQKIYDDPYGVQTWDQRNCARFHLHILNSAEYKAMTGIEPPSTTVSSRTYAEYGFPWFDLYDEAIKDVTPPTNLKEVKPIDQLVNSSTEREERQLVAKELPVRRLGKAEKRNTKS